MHSCVYMWKRCRKRVSLLVLKRDWESVCVFVCLCVFERERERGETLRYPLAIMSLCGSCRVDSGLLYLLHYPCLFLLVIPPQVEEVKFPWNLNSKFKGLISHYLRKSVFYLTKKLKLKKKFSKKFLMQFGWKVLSSRVQLFHMSLQ